MNVEKVWPKIVGLNSCIFLFFLLARESVDYEKRPFIFDSSGAKIFNGTLIFDELLAKYSFARWHVGDIRHTANNFMKTECNEMRVVSDMLLLLPCCIFLPTQHSWHPQQVQDVVPAEDHLVAWAIFPVVYSIIKILIRKLLGMTSVHWSPWPPIK